MTVGLFGKLPAKRDYIEHSVDRAVMKKWDPWLQQAVSASRDQLGREWLELYLQAPIWRFWLGADICGKQVLGALMPSVDGVGRYFPLSLIWSGDDVIAPPEDDEQSDWYSAAEEILLGALGEAVRYESLLAALELLPPLRTGPAGQDDDATVPGLFRSLRRDRMADFYAGQSCWWVASHDDGATAPKAFMRHGLPAPSDYSTMISGAGAGDGQGAVPLAVGEASNA